MRDITSYENIFRVFFFFFFFLMKRDHDDGSLNNIFFGTIIIINYLSLSSLLRRPIFNAVCLTSVPNTLLDTTMPSINGVARFILEVGPCNLTLMSPLARD